VASVLVTGATGFIGRALVEELLRHGKVVTAAVRRDAVLPAGVRVARAGDVGPTTDWREALASCQAVVHLAARVHVMHDHAADPLAAYREVNVAGTLALARQAAASGVKRFAFVSSIKVNGEGTLPDRPYRETDVPAPVDAYGISKLEAEQGLRALAASSGMEVVVIRPPLVYGPGVQANFLSMARWVARGVPLPLGAVRGNRRSLLGLDNLVDLIFVCLHHPSAANEVFLAADGEDLSTTDLLRRTAAAIGVPARLVPVPPALLEAGAAMLGKRAVVQRLCGSLQVDIGKARSVLGWRPPVGVDEGLSRAVQGLGAGTT
jgi:nucleoside-diphosphate-sugar epimerase